jgi:hypothetical protein
MHNLATKPPYIQYFNHPKLEVPRQTCLGRESNPGLRGEPSSKELFEQLINSYSEHLHMSPRHGYPQCMWLHEHAVH